jgi:LacI family transcriptional regulator
MPLASDRRFVVFERDASFLEVQPILDGVRDYFADHTEDPFSFIPDGLRQHVYSGHSIPDSVHALLCWITDRDTLPYIHRLDVPYLNFSGVRGGSNVGLDLGFEHIGESAAHFLSKDLSFDHIAVVGQAGSAKSEERIREFLNTTGLFGRTVSEFRLERGDTSAATSAFEAELHRARLERSQLVPFLKALPKPVGIFCVHGALGYHCANTVRGLGYEMPREVNIVCPSNYLFDSEYHQQSISTIQLDFRELGYRGAESMMEYLRSGTAPKRLRLRPIGVNPAAKVSASLVRDSLARQALCLIREDCSITPEQICTRLGVSPSTLHRRFKKATQITLGKAIEDERFARAKLLLRTTDYQLVAIAGLAGYTGVSQMRRSVFRYTHLSLSKFRKRCKTTCRHR